MNPNLIRKPGNHILRALVVGATLWAAFPAGAQESEGVPTMAGAQTALNSQQPAEAKRMLEAILASDAENPRGWFMLGQANYALGEADAAIAAFTHGLDNPQTRPSAQFMMGRTYAQADDLDNAFKWLMEAKGEGFGIGPADSGDVDGDGYIDFLVTSAWSAVNGPRSGRTFILSGAPQQ